MGDKQAYQDAFTRLSQRVTEVERNQEMLAFQVSIRDFFAGCALIALATAADALDTHEQFAKWSFDLADALLDVRKAREVE